MQVFLTTTGTQTNTIIDDLGKAVFVHPKTNIPLIEPLGEFTEKDISTSTNLITAVVSGFITLTNVDGTNIITLTDITNKTNDHGNQTGLLDDDHTQYLNNTRGDVRYLSRTLNSGNLYVGNASNVGTAVTFSGDATITNTGIVSLSNVGTAGTYRNVTVDAKGRVTSGANPTTLAGHGITDAQPLDGDLTALAALSTVGFVGRTAADTYVPRTMAGTLNRIFISNGNGVAAAPVFDISPNYVGQTTINTLGTITTGTWNASTVPILYGGTGATTADAALNNLLPSQAGNALKVLTTNGLTSDWQSVDFSSVTFQFLYDNSPSSNEITTNTGFGSFSIKRGSTADIDEVFEIFNGADESKFTVLGNGTVNIKDVLGSTNLVVAPTISDPNIATKSPTIYVESTRTGNNDGLRIYYNDGTPGIAGYTNFTYNGSAPELILKDMDDDPSYINFSIARLGLAVNPGTFDNPSIVSKFGMRGPIAGGTTGFSWLTNNGTSGDAPIEIMSCDRNFLSIPTTTTALRATPAVNGMIAYNSTLNKVDAYENGAWTQYVDTTTNQTIAGDKTFTGKLRANVEVQQYFNATSVTTTSATFAVVPGMTLTTANSVATSYIVKSMVNIRNSTTNGTVVELQIFVNGVADADTIINYTAGVLTPFFIPLEKVYVDAAPGTVYTVRWRRVSGTATPTITNKTFKIIEIL
jgi:hypothetical protein